VLLSVTKIVVAIILPAEVPINGTTLRARTVVIFLKVSVIVLRDL